MGAADIVPGVSGGTMALILGIYQRLISAISHVDLSLLGHVRERRWADAFAHADGRFLITLAAGIGTGVVSLASLMHHLLEHEMGLTFGAFFGLILASSWLVARMVGDWTPTCGAAAALGAIFAFWLTGLVPVVVTPSYGYIFFAGTIAICAMILPGISGAFVLLIFGVYYHVTGVLKALASGSISLDNLATLVVFGLGCVTGLLIFSRVLRFLLDRAHALTMAVLCGFMFGSLRKIWPFKVEIDASVDKDFKERIFENVWPWQSPDGFLLPFAMILVGAALVLVLDRVSGGASRQGGVASGD